MFFAYPRAASSLPPCSPRLRVSHSSGISGVFRPFRVFRRSLQGLGRKARWTTKCTKKHDDERNFQTAADNALTKRANAECSLSARNSSCSYPSCSSCPSWFKLSGFILPNDIATLAHDPPVSRTQQRRREAGVIVSDKFGWGTRIRTLVDGVRVRSPAARRSPKKRGPRALGPRARCGFLPQS